MTGEREREREKERDKGTKSNSDGKQRSFTLKGAYLSVQLHSAKGWAHAGMQPSLISTKVI